MGGKAAITTTPALKNWQWSIDFKRQAGEIEVGLKEKIYCILMTKDYPH